MNSVGLGGGCSLPALLQSALTLNCKTFLRLWARKVSILVKLPSRWDIVIYQSFFFFFFLSTACFLCRSVVVSWVEAGCAASSQGSWQELFLYYLWTCLRICFPVFLKVLNPFCAAVSSWHALLISSALYSATLFPWAPCCFQDKNNLIPSMDLICCSLHQS